MAAIETLGRKELRRGDPAMPRLSTILREVENQTHPLREFRRMVNDLHLAYTGEPASDEVLDLFMRRCGHRTDADLEAAYRKIIGNGAIHKMPTPADFLDHCPPMRERRTA